METKEFTNEDMTMIIKAIDYAYSIVEEEHDDDLTNPLIILKAKLKWTEEFGIGIFTNIDAEVIKSAIHVFILNSLEDHNFNEASKALSALSALNKLPE